MRKVPMHVLGLLFLFVMAGQAYASTVSYFVTVPKFGGSAYSGIDTKVFACSDIHVYMSQVGGNYSVRVTPQDGNFSNASVTQTMGDNQSLSFKEDRLFCGVGAQRRLKFNTTFSTPVNVQVSGSFDAG